MMKWDWGMILGYLAADEIRLLFGLYLTAKFIKVLPDRKIWILAAAGGAVSVLDSMASPLAGGFFYSCAELAVLASAAWYYRREKIRECLFLIFFYEVGVGLWDFLISAGIGILFQSRRFTDTGAWEYLAGVFLVRGIMGAYVWMEWKKKRNNKRNVQEIPGTDRLVSAVSLFGLFGAVTLSQQHILALDEDQVGTWIILSMVLLFAVLFYRVNRQKDMETEISRLKQEQAEILERDYRTLSRTYADNAKLYHDLHNHIETIYQCLVQGDTEEAVKYCRELREPVYEIIRTIWTGDKAADYLISSKISMAEQKGVRTEINIEFPRNANIRSVDLTAILGNLLDNALEAAETAEGRMRFLKLTIRRINAMLIIKVENGCGREPVSFKGEWQTAKKDAAFHGWGLKSAETAAERYEGTVCTDYKNGVFRAAATLSCSSVPDQKKRA